MNAIHLILMIGLWFFAIMECKAYMNMRDEFIKSGNSEPPKELKKTKRTFISSAVTAIIYTIIKLT